LAIDIRNSLSTAKAIGINMAEKLTLVASKLKPKDFQ
jgi:hypothetical protein